MEEEQEERKVRDLIRARELAVRPRLCERLLSLLDRRRLRRPAGCSARLYAKMGWEDPFLLPDDEKLDVHRPVYVAGRFVRFDQAEKKKKKNDPREKIRRMQEKQAQQRERANQLAQERSKREARVKGAGGVSSARSAAQSAARGPSAEQQADIERRRAVRERRHGSQDPNAELIDRTPPTPKPKTRASGSGRFRAGSMRPSGRRKVVQGGEPPGGRHLPEPQGPPQPDEAPRRRGKVVQGGEPPGGRPPVVVPDSQEQSDNPFFVQSRREVHRLPTPPQKKRERRVVDVTPSSPDEPAPAAPEPVPEPPKPEVDRSPTRAGGLGLDDLFGGFGGNEGRVRIGRRSKKKSSEEEDA